MREGRSCEYIPSGLNEICRSAFVQCTALQTATIPEGIVHLPIRGVGWCSSLKFVKLPSSLKTIGELACLWSLPRPLYDQLRKLVRKPQDDGALTTLAESALARKISPHAEILKCKNAEATSRNYGQRCPVHSRRRLYSQSPRGHCENREGADGRPRYDYKVAKARG